MEELSAFWFTITIQDSCQKMKFKCILLSIKSRNKIWTLLSMILLVKAWPIPMEKKGNTNNFWPMKSKTSKSSIKRYFSITFVTCFLYIHRYVCKSTYCILTLSFLKGARIGWRSNGHQEHWDVQYHSGSKSYGNFPDLLGSKASWFVWRNGSCKNDSVCVEEIHQRQETSCSKGEVQFIIAVIYSYDFI